MRSRLRSSTSALLRTMNARRSSSLHPYLDRSTPPGQTPAGLASSEPKAALAGVALARSGTTSSRLGAVAAIAISSRLLTWLAAALASACLTSTPRLAPAKSVLRHAASLFAPHSAAGILFGPWANWDGTWFTSIASRGYVRLGGPAFFPLYPLTMRAAAPFVGGHYVVAGVLLSLLFFTLACLLLYRLLAEEFSPRIALWSVIFLSVFPTSFFFGAAYSESLFLFTSVVCFYLARRRRFWLAGLAGAAATLTRNSGLLLLLPMGMYYMDARGWKLSRIDRRVVSLALVPAGLVVYMAYLWARFGDALYFLHAEADWRRAFALPPVTLYRGAVDFVRTVRRLVVHRSFELSTPHNVVAMAAVILLLVLIVAGWRRLPRPYTAYAIVSVLLPLCYPERTMPFMSMARFAVVVFPLFVTMALVTVRRPRLRVAAVVVCLAGLLVLTTVFALRLYFIG
jgi:Mannosyltransferase (PIG-V)